MTYLTPKWLLVLVMTLGMVISPCEKSAAAEPGGKSSVLYAIPRPPETKKKELPATGPESGKPPVPRAGQEDQAQVPVEAPAVTGDLPDDARPLYEPKSLLDPFVPLIQEKPVVPPEDPDSGKPRRVLTPLEKMTLGQIELVAVVMGESLKIAMVQDATGKGYEVRIGTYMGKNGGQVVDIQSDRIIVREMVADFKGVVTERFEELKLHKADSGE